MGREQGAAARRRSSSVDLVPARTSPASDRGGKEVEWSLEGGEQKGKEKLS